VSSTAIRAGLRWHAHRRALQTVNQRAYRKRRRDGMKSFRLEADPTDVADMLREAGVIVPNGDARTLEACLTAFVRLWAEGRISV
jgi:hypothetical protein